LPVNAKGRKTNLMYLGHKNIHSLVSNSAWFFEGTNEVLVMKPFEVNFLIPFRTTKSIVVSKTVG
jgi:hypothetical protein